MAIDERSFINKKRTHWEQLSLIVERTKNGGLSRLTKQELPALGSLYRRAAADLAYARQQGANPNLILYLNELVGNAHGVIYAEESGGWSRIWRFMRYGLPAVLRRRMPFVIASIIITVIGMWVAYALVHKSESYLSAFMPEQFRSSFDAWKQGFADHGDLSAGEGLEMSGFLMQNNIRVGIVAFATGITFVLPVSLLFYNGATMGALIAVVQPTHHLTSMWAGILPHGVWELSAIFICGGAGMVISWALIAPGEYSRKDALVLAGRDACKMMVGTIPMFIIAGFIEGNLSHSSLPHWAKFGLSGVEFIVLVSYIYGSRPGLPRPAPQTQTA